MQIRFGSARLKVLKIKIGSARFGWLIFRFGSVRLKKTLTDRISDMYKKNLVTEETKTKKLVALLSFFFINVVYLLLKLDK